MKPHRRFWIAVTVTVAALLILGIWVTLNTVRTPRPWTITDGIAILGLGINAAVGFLTIYGLGWAAREFSKSSAQSDLRLVLRRTASHAPYPTITTLRGVVDKSGIKSTYRGRQEEFGVQFALLIENKGARTGEALVVSLRLQHSRGLKSGVFNYQTGIPDPPPNHQTPIQRETDHQTSLTIRPGQDLRIYRQVSPEYIGNVVLAWQARPGTDASPPPTFLDIECTIASSDRITNTQRLHLPINITEWQTAQASFLALQNK